MTFREFIRCIYGDESDFTLAGKVLMTPMVALGFVVALLAGVFGALCAAMRWVMVKR
jgi:hypothetical protein